MGRLTAIADLDGSGEAGYGSGLLFGDCVGLIASFIR
jgi:hypothetical protein